MVRKEREVVSTGLALGGLAGNNAHGAGVLQATLDYDVEPELISCTSGQIHWVDRYLKARNAEGPRRKALRRALKEDIDSLSPTKIEAIDATWAALTGKPHVFRPALQEFPLNVARNLSAALTKIVTSASTNWQTVFSSYREFAGILPAQTLVPLFPDSFFQEINDDFNQTKDVGIVFNSYDVHNGEEYVYLNDRARNLLDVAYGEHDRYRQGTTYRRISPEAVREGLWLYEYGEPRDVSAIDGAYYRQVMLSELSRARTIYVARPINSRWLGSFPSSWIGLEDLKTEVNFNGTYSGERDKIALLNKLLGEKAINAEKVSRKGYHQINLVEFEIQTQQGYFDYAHEYLAVFDRAYDEVQPAFARHKDYSNEPSRESKGTNAP
jgi:hypothetical protein